ncbi:MAG: hypothetical protein JO081_00010 [Alphaproteobacteria bacterium]|nr:hypothetical protein [Alphaproteobacteria bacterium]
MPQLEVVGCGAQGFPGRVTLDKNQSSVDPMILARPKYSEFTAKPAFGLKKAQLGSGPAGSELQRVARPIAALRIARGNPVSPVLSGRDQECAPSLHHVRMTTSRVAYNAIMARRWLS